MKFSLIRLRDASKSNGPSHNPPFRYMTEHSFHIFKHSRSSKPTKKSYVVHTTDVILSLNFNFMQMLIKHNKLSESKKIIIYLCLCEKRSCHLNNFFYYLCVFLFKKMFEIVEGDCSFSLCRGVDFNVGSGGLINH